MYLDILRKLRQNPSNKLGQIPQFTNGYEDPKYAKLADKAKQEMLTTAKSDIVQALSDPRNAIEKATKATNFMYNESRRLYTMLNEIAGSDIQTGYIEVEKKLVDWNKAQEDLVTSTTHFAERNKELNSAFGLNVLNAQIFSDELLRIGNIIGSDDVDTRDFALSLQELTNGFINASSDVHKATVSQDLQNVKLLAGQSILRNNIGLTKENALAFEKYAALQKVSAYDLYKVYEAGSDAAPSFLTKLAESTGKSELQLTKEIMSEIAQLGSEIQLEYSKMGSNLEIAVLKARALGLSMTNVSGVGKKLLNVQEAASFETEFQLLTGKRLTVEGGKNFIQEMQVAKLKRDAPKQAQLLYEVLNNVGDELRNNQFSMDSFVTNTGLSESQVADALAKMETAKKYQIDLNKLTKEEDLQKKLEEVKKTKIEEVTKSGKTDTEKEDEIELIKKDMEALKNLPDKTTLTAGEQMIKDGLKDIADLLRARTTKFVREDGDGKIVKKDGVRQIDGSVGIDLQRQGKLVKGAVRAKKDDKVDLGDKSIIVGATTMQEEKLNPATVMQDLGQQKLYKQTISTQTGGAMNPYKETIEDVERDADGNVLQTVTDAVESQDARAAGVILLNAAASPAATPVTTTNATHSRGGILNGPSHAQGGIATLYGELEGGEAIINKRSTEKYAPILSAVNEAEGGTKFAPTISTSEINNNEIIEYLQESSKIIPPQATTNINNINLNTNELATAITNAFKNTNQGGMDTDKLARAIADAMRNVKIETTAVVKTDNTYRESSLNNAPRFIS